MTVRQDSLAVYTGSLLAAAGCLALVRTLRVSPFEDDQFLLGVLHNNKNILDLTIFRGFITREGVGSRDLVPTDDSVMSQSLICQ